MFYLYFRLNSVKLLKQRKLDFSNIYLIYIYIKKKHNYITKIWSITMSMYKVRLGPLTECDHDRIVVEFMSSYNTSAYQYQL
jgi:hypothetical protein